ncbi:MAG: winged helix-turn-helix domain-containing protein [Candidatus Natronoplasma sp.]
MLSASVNSLQLFSHIDWKDLLSHSDAKILTQLCSSKQNIQQLSEITNKTERTVRVNLKKPKEIGLVKQKEVDYKITERFTSCSSFLILISFRICHPDGFWVLTHFTA